MGNFAAVIAANFYYDIKRFFIAVPCRSRGKIPPPLGIQISGKGKRVLTRSAAVDRSFPRNQFERRPKTPPPLSLSPNDRFRHLGTNFQTWSGRGGEQKEGRRGDGFHARSRAVRHQPHQPRVFTFIELRGGERRGGVNRNPSLSLLTPLCLPALSFL